MNTYRIFAVVVLGISLLVGSANAYVPSPYGLDAFVTESSDYGGAYDGYRLVEDWILPGNLSLPAMGTNPEQVYWMSSPLQGSTPPKIVSEQWVVLDLGEDKVLDEINIWNYYEDTSWSGNPPYDSSGRQVQEYGLWIAMDGAAAPTHGVEIETPFSAMDGWVQIVAGGTLAREPMGVVENPPDSGLWEKGPAIGPTATILGTIGQTARYVGIDIISNYGDLDHVGLTQVQIVPEPATLILLGLGGLALRRRRN